MKDSPLILVHMDYGIQTMSCLAYYTSLTSFLLFYFTDSLEVRVDAMTCLIKDLIDQSKFSNYTNYYSKHSNSKTSKKPCSNGTTDDVQPDKMYSPSDEDKDMIYMMSMLEYCT